MKLNGNRAVQSGWQRAKSRFATDFSREHSFQPFTKQKRGGLFAQRVCLLLLVVISVKVHNCVVAHADENPLHYQPLMKPGLHSVAGEGQNFFVKTVMLPLSFYANVLSRVDGDRCPSHPPCSLYARQAVNQYGTLLGLWMMVDRLIHERTEIVRGAAIGHVVEATDGRALVLDTLEENDFWLRAP